MANYEFHQLLKPPQSIDELVPRSLDADFRKSCIKNIETLMEHVRGTEVLTFFVGAGISAFRPASLPVARQVLNFLFSYCAEFCPDISSQIQLIHDAMKQNRPIMMENTLQHLYEVVEPRTFYTVRIFETSLEPVRYNVNHEFLARWLQLGQGTIITTNLDVLIEQAWNHVIHVSPHQLEVIRHPKQFEKWESIVRLNSPAIWKLHGSADDPSSWAITLGKVAFELQDSRADFLTRLIPKHSLCFVGWQAADLDIFPRVSEALKRSEETHELFWIFYANEKYKTLEDYLKAEPNVGLLFGATRDRILPIVSTAERLSAWLLDQRFNIKASIPDPSIKHEIDYNWLKLDIHTAHEFGIRKLVGFVLKGLGLYDTSGDVLESAGKLALMRASQLFQESAHTYWQMGKKTLARQTVRKAYMLLCQGNDAMRETWCHFGLITMTLDGGKGVRIWEKAVALVQLYKLLGRFRELAKNSQLTESAQLGVGLCSLNLVKRFERLSMRFHLNRIPRVRKAFLKRYSSIEESVRIGGHAPSLLDVWRRQAFLLVYENPQHAVAKILDALRVSEAVGHQYEIRTLRDAYAIAKLVRDAALEETVDKRLASIQTQQVIISKS